MATLVNETEAMSRRLEYPGSYKIWVEARRLKVYDSIKGGMEIVEAKDIISRADFARRVERALTCCQESGARVPAGDYLPSQRKLKINSPELISSINAIVATDKRKEEKALLGLKRTLLEWPTCKFSGTLAPVWDKHGLCTWACTVCK